MAELQHTTRRAFMKAAPALVAIPAAAQAGEADETFALIEAHLVAETAFRAACEASDITITGRLSTERERQAVEATGDAMDDAAIALCAYAPTTIEGSRAKVRAILESYLADNIEEVDGPMIALIRSVALMVRA